MWERLHRVLLDRLGQPDRWTGRGPPGQRQRAAKRGASDRAEPDRPGQGGHQAPPRCATATGSRWHVLVTGANAHDSRCWRRCWTPTPACANTHGPGRPRRRPGKLHADKGYDYPPLPPLPGRRGIGVRIARTGSRTAPGSGRLRWVVERTLSWLLNFRRLALRYDRAADTISALSPGRRPDLSPPAAQQPHQREPRITEADAEGPADRRVDAASGRQASSANRADPEGPRPTNSRRSGTSRCCGCLVRDEQAAAFGASSWAASPTVLERSSSAKLDWRSPVAMRFASS